MESEFITEVMDMLYVAKLFDDHEMLDRISDMDDYLSCPEDNYYEFLNTAGMCVFGDCEGLEIDPYCESGLRFTDPAMTRFYKLCRKYQKVKGISKKRNLFLLEANAKIKDALTFNSWCYDYRIHANPTKKDGCALIFFMSPEFYFGSEVTAGFFELLDFYKDGVKRLEAAINECRGKVIPFPAPASVFEEVAA